MGKTINIKQKRELIVYKKIIKLIDVFENIDDIDTFGYYFFLSEDNNWSLDSKCIIDTLLDVPPEMDINDSNEIPKYILRMGMRPILSLDDIVDIKYNINMQGFSATNNLLLKGVRYFWENDAFPDLSNNQLKV